MTRKKLLAIIIPVAILVLALIGGEEQLTTMLFTTSATRVTLK